MWLAGLLAALCGCPGTRGPMELGEACWDGKDNDGDGAVDCKDPDCGYLSFCSAGADLGLLPDLPGVRIDHGTAAPDLFGPPPPDRGGSTTGSYGSTCTFTGRGTCADGQSVCILSPGGAGKAFCSRPCATLGAACPGGPTGSFAACVYQFGGRPFCTFLCKFKGLTYPCPTGFSCTADSRIPQYQAWCWP